MKISTKIILALTLILVAVLGRLMPHAWNFTPIVGVSLFAGAYLGKKYAFIVPLFAMVISDIFIGLYDWKMMVVVYASFCLSGLIGVWLGKNKTSAPKLILSSIGASTLFYLTTNTSVWLFGTIYQSGPEGLVASLIAGIPFFRNMLVGDIYFSFMIFGTYELIIFAKDRLISFCRKPSSI